MGRSQNFAPVSPYPVVGCQGKWGAPGALGALGAQRLEILVAQAAPMLRASTEEVRGLEEVLRKTSEVGAVMLAVLPDLRAVESAVSSMALSIVTAMGSPTHSITAQRL